MEKLKIGGLKQSLELCQFDLRGPDLSEKMIGELSKLMSAQKINIEFLTYASNRDSAHQLSLCINQDTFSAASNILKKHGALPCGWHVSSREHVGIITVFPHRSAINILGAVMVSWTESSIPIHGIATSLSSISFVTDYPLMERAAEVVQGLFTLPENRAPLKPEIRYIQSDIVKGK